MTKDGSMTPDTQGDHNGDERLRAELLTGPPPANQTL